jgi:hypothetical protein
MECTYHKDIGLPRDYQRPIAGLTLTYSRHATDRSREKGIALPATLPACEVIEVTLDHATAVKWVIRFALTTDTDLVLVLLPDGFVKTAWTNDKRDNHRTLDHSKYERTTR